MGIGLKYIGEGKAVGMMPKRDLSPYEAEAYAREYGGVDAVLATGIYEKASSAKPSKAQAERADEE